MSSTQKASAAQVQAQAPPSESDVSDHPFHSSFNMSSDISGSGWNSTDGTSSYEIASSERDDTTDSDDDEVEDETTERNGRKVIVISDDEDIRKPNLSSSFETDDDDDEEEEDYESSEVETDPDDKKKGRARLENNHNDDPEEFEEVSVDDSSDDIPNAKQRVDPSDDELDQNDYHSGEYETGSSDDLVITTDDDDETDEDEGAGTTDDDDGGTTDDDDDDEPPAGTTAQPQARGGGNVDSTDDDDDDEFDTDDEDDNEFLSDDEDLEEDSSDDDDSSSEEDDDDLDDSEDEEEGFQDEPNTKILFSYEELPEEEREKLLRYEPPMESIKEELDDEEEDGDNEHEKFIDEDDDIEYIEKKDRWTSPLVIFIICCCCILILAVVGVVVWLLVLRDNDDNDNDPIPTRPPRPPTVTPTTSAVPTISPTISSIPTISSSSQPSSNNTEVPSLLSVPSTIPSMIPSLFRPEKITIPVTGDTYVRNGIFADTTFGTEDQFLIQGNINTRADSSYAILSFNTTDILEPYLLDDSTLISTVQLQLHHVATNIFPGPTKARIQISSWTDYDTNNDIERSTWNTVKSIITDRATSDNVKIGPIFNVAANDQFMTIDITDLVLLSNNNNMDPSVNTTTTRSNTNLRRRLRQRRQRKRRTLQSSSTSSQTIGNPIVLSLASSPNGGDNDDDGVTFRSREYQNGAFEPAIVVNFATSQSPLPPSVSPAILTPPIPAPAAPSIPPTRSQLPSTSSQPTPIPTSSSMPTTSLQPSATPSISQAPSQSNKPSRTPGVGWYLSDHAGSCVDICGQYELECNVDGNFKVNSESRMEYILTNTTLQNSDTIHCDRYAGIDGSHHAPYIDISPITGIVSCLSRGNPPLLSRSTCNDTHIDGKRLCCCTTQEDIDNGDTESCPVIVESASLQPGWYLSDMEGSCGDICDENGLVCNIMGNENVNSQSRLEYILTNDTLQNSDNVVCNDGYNGIIAAATPFVTDFISAGVDDSIPCYFRSSAAEDSTCDIGGGTYGVRVCCCTTQEHVDNDDISSCPIGLPSTLAPTRTATPTNSIQPSVTPSTSSNPTITLYPTIFSSTPRQVGPTPPSQAPTITSLPSASWSPTTCYESSQPKLTGLQGTPNSIPVGDVFRTIGQSNNHTNSTNATITFEIRQLWTDNLVWIAPFWIDWNNTLNCQRTFNVPRNTSLVYENIPCNANLDAAQIGIAINDESIPNGEFTVNLPDGCNAHETDLPNQQTIYFIEISCTTKCDLTS